MDAGSVTSIFGVATSGRRNSNQWVKSYTVEYSKNYNGPWSKVNGADGKVKKFGANNNRNTQILNEFTKTINARYVRIYPQSWQGHVSMRAGLYVVGGGSSTPCSACPAGQYANGGGRSTCTACPAGKYGGGQTRKEDSGVHGPFRGQTVSKQFKLPTHKSITVSFRFWSIDSWDGNEYGSVKVDSTEVFRKTRTNARNCQGSGGGWKEYKKSFYNPWNGNRGGEKCYADYNADMKKSIAHTDSAVTIAFSSNMNQNVRDESWFFNRFKLTAGTLKVDETAKGAFSATGWMSPRTNCNNCPSGRSQSKTGQASPATCTACVKGEYQNQAGKATCKACGVDSYGTATGQTRCIGCQAGTYAPAGNKPTIFNPPNMRAASSYHSRGLTVNNGRLNSGASWSAKQNTGTYFTGSVNYDGGAHGPFHQKQSVTKIFRNLAKHDSVIISARFWAIDSWDGNNEYGQMTVDGQTGFRKVRGRYSDCRRSGNGQQTDKTEWSKYNGNFYNPWGGKRGGKNKCYEDFTAVMPHTTSAAIVTFYASINSANNDESFFFNRFVMQTKYDGVQDLAYMKMTAQRAPPAGPASPPAPWTATATRSGTASRTLPLATPARTPTTAASPGGASTSARAPSSRPSRLCTAATAAATACRAPRCTPPTRTTTRPP